MKLKVPKETVTPKMPSKPLTVLKEKPLVPKMSVTWAPLLKPKLP